MKQTLCAVVAVLTIFLLPSHAFADFGVGDIAPALSIADWVKGEKVDLAKEIGKKIIMVEFWATWCGPCKISVPRLTEIQKKHKKDLVIIGVTAADGESNSPAQIKRFVSNQGEQMDYTVAIDKGTVTTAAYMGAAKVDGIPHAFLVGKDGKIAWQGSPLDPEMEEVVARLVAGKFDVAAAKLDRQIMAKLEELQMYAQMGQWSAVKDGLVSVLKLDPGHEMALGGLQTVFAEHLDDPAGFRTWAKSHIAAHKGNARAMQSLAGVLCNGSDLTTRLPDLALEAAKAAYGASKPASPSAASVFALALYQIGALDRAIALQQEAVAAAEGAEKKQLQSELEFYRQCKQLQSTVNP